MTQAYTNSRQYYMLDDLVEATGAAKKVSLPCTPLPQSSKIPGAEKRWSPECTHQ